ncbi:MAG: CarD family transcriptional regulator [Candidatus Babeliales bacterium]
MFKLNDKVVFPGHGVAAINRVIKKIVGGKTTTFYELKFINKDMTILVPTDEHGHATGIRSLSSPENIENLFDFLSKPATNKSIAERSMGNWKQRNKEYQSKLMTGDLYRISEIYRELKCIEHNKELSFCEKNLLNQTESLLAEEVALVKKLHEEKALEDLRSIFTSTIFKGKSSDSQKTI